MTGLKQTLNKVIAIRWLTIALVVIATTGCSTMAPVAHQSDGAPATEVLAAWKRADKLYARGQYSGAREAYRMVHQREPENTDVLLKLANIAYYLQERDLARDLYAEVADLGSTDPRFFYNRAALNLTEAYQDLAQYRDQVGPAGLPMEIRAVMAAVERMSDADRPDQLDQESLNNLSSLEGGEAQ